MRKTSNPELPLSLYVHIPFCSAKCPYCAFYSRRPEAGDLSRFMGSLAREISLYSRSRGMMPKVRTAFIGGGTPTILGPDHWEGLAVDYGAQIDAYAKAVEQGSEKKIKESWLFLPVAGGGIIIATVP